MRRGSRHHTRSPPDTAPSSRHDLTGLANAIADSIPALDEHEQRLTVALYRVLAEGQPVTTQRLAEHTNDAVGALLALAERWKAVVFDDDHSVVELWGLSLHPSPHRMRIDGRQLYTWCAWDTLFLPELIGRPATIQSTCPITRGPISLALDGDGPHALSPAQTVLSFSNPSSRASNDTKTSFCEFVHFFASPTTGRQWTTAHDDTFLLSITDAYQLARAFNHAKFNHALDA